MKQNHHSKLADWGSVVLHKGMKEGEMLIIADFIHEVLKDFSNTEIVAKVKQNVLCKKFPLPTETKQNTIIACALVILLPKIADILVNLFYFFQLILSMF